MGAACHSPPPPHPPGPCRGSLHCSHMLSKVPPPTHILNIAAGPGWRFNHCQSQSCWLSKSAPAASGTCIPHRYQSWSTKLQTREQRPPVALRDTASGERGARGGGQPREDREFFSDRKSP